MARVLLAGATGHLGGHVLKHLGANGHSVRALVRSPEQAEELRGFVSETRVADLTEASSLRGVCDGIDSAISTAGASVHINVRGSRSFGEVDRAGNLNLLAEARRSGARKFICVSVLTNPALAETVYVREKEAIARAVAASGMDYLILRPTGFFSAYADLVPMARKGALPLIAGGRALTNPIDDEEVAIACVAGIEEEDREISLGGPDILSRREISELAFRALNRPAKFRMVPAGPIRLASKCTRLFNRRLGDLIEFYAAVSTNDAVAPSLGTRRLVDYLLQIGRFS